MARTMVTIRNVSEVRNAIRNSGSVGVDIRFHPEIDDAERTAIINYLRRAPMVTVYGLDDFNRKVLMIGALFLVSVVAVAGHRPARQPRLDGGENANPEEHEGGGIKWVWEAVKHASHCLLRYSRLIEDVIPLVDAAVGAYHDRIGFITVLPANPDEVPAVVAED